MASLQDCEHAVQSLADRLAAISPEVRNKYLVERTVSCRVPDLGVVFLGRLCEQGLADLRTTDDAAAQVRLCARSDDLVALAEGRMQVPSAWATGRLKIDASLRDLLKLRTLL